MSITLTPCAAADRVLELRRDKSLDDAGVRRALRRDPAQLLVLAQPVLGEQRADLVARQQLHAPDAVPDGDAHPVAVRVGRHAPRRTPSRSAVAIAIDERLRVLGVRGLDRRKARIERHLLEDLEDVAARVDEQRHGVDRRPCRGCSCRRPSGCAAQDGLVHDRRPPRFHIRVVLVAAEGRDPPQVLGQEVAARPRGARRTLGRDARVVGRDDLAPSTKYALKPLSWGGLWLAVMTTPGVRPRQRTVKLSCGVGLGPSKMNASPPSRAQIDAASSQKCRE